MATKNEYFNPIIEAMKAAGQNAVNFVMHPTEQSQRAAQVAQEMLSNYGNVARATSPLQPYMRPGVPEEAMTPEQIELVRRSRMGGGLLGNGQ